MTNGEGERERSNFEICRGLSVCKAGPTAGLETADLSLLLRACRTDGGTRGRTAPRGHTGGAEQGRRRPPAPRRTRRTLKQ